MLSTRSRGADGAPGHLTVSTGEESLSQAHNTGSSPPPTPDHCLLPAPDVSVVGCRLRPATACSEHVITDFVSTHSKATTSLLGHGHQLHRWTSYSIRHKTTTEQVCRSCLLCGISGTGFQRIECSSCQPTNSVAASREAGNLQHLTTHVDYCYAAL